MFETKPGKVIDKCRGCDFIEGKTFNCELMECPQEEWEPKAGCWGQLYGDKIYLSGSIDAHIDQDKPRAWREIATKELEQLGYTVINPMHNKEKYTSTKQLVEADLADLKRCSTILVEMTFDNMPYIGTSMEIREAYNDFKEIIVFGEANQNSEFLKYHATRWVPTLEAAIGCLRRRTHKGKE